MAMKSSPDRPAGRASSDAAEVLDGIRAMLIKLLLVTLPRAVKSLPKRDRAKFLDGDKQVIQRLADEAVGAIFTRKKVKREKTQKGTKPKKS